jgi:hypothetical protein
MYILLPYLYTYILIYIYSCIRMPIFVCWYYFYTLHNYMHKFIYINAYLYVSFANIHIHANSHIYKFFCIHVHKSDLYIYAYTYLCIHLHFFVIWIWAYLYATYVASVCADLIYCIFFNECMNIYTYIFLKYLYRKINTALSRQFIILLQRSFLHWKLNVDVLKMQKCIERFWALSGVLNWSASALFSKFVCEIKFSDIIMWVLCNHIDHHFTYIQSHVFGMKFLKWCRHIAHPYWLNSWSTLI